MANYKQTKQTFSATILQEEGKKATGIPIPAAVVSALGSGKRPKVKVSLNNFTYRSTIAAYGDIFMLPRSQARREAVPACRQVTSAKAEETRQRRIAKIIVKLSEE